MDLPVLEAICWETAVAAGFEGDEGRFAEMATQLGELGYDLTLSDEPVRLAQIRRRSDGESMRHPLVPPGFSWTNPETTAERVHALEAYMQGAVLGPRGFCCTSEQACLGPLRRHAQVSVWEGQLSHVGRHYDFFEGGERLRVVVVGQEYGHGPAEVTLERRYHWIYDHRGLATPFRQRNPHMRGTTLALRVLHGLAPDRIDDGDWLTTDNGHRVHLFDTFALVNAVLCSAVLPGTAKGRAKGVSTPQMQQNCLRHFDKTLEILEPSVLVVQGKGVAAWIAPVFDAEPTSLNDDGTLVGVVHRGRPIIAGQFTHPAAFGKQNWANPNSAYLKATVTPALQRARAMVLGSG